MTYYLIGVDHRSTDQLIKIMFLSEVRTDIRSRIKSRFGIPGFSISVAISGLWFPI